jgi:hypothetical protein
VWCHTRRCRSRRRCTSTSRSPTCHEHASPGSGMDGALDPFIAPFIWTPFIGTVPRRCGVGQARKRACDGALRVGVGGVEELSGGQTDAMAHTSIDDGAHHGMQAALCSVALAGHYLLVGRGGSGAVCSVGRSTPSTRPCPAHLCRRRHRRSSFLSPRDKVHCDACSGVLRPSENTHGVQTARIADLRNAPEPQASPDSQPQPNVWLSEPLPACVHSKAIRGVGGSAGRR